MTLLEALARKGKLTVTQSCQLVGQARTKRRQEWEVANWVRVSPELTFMIIVNRSRQLWVSCRAKVASIQTSFNSLRCPKVKTSINKMLRNSSQHLKNPTLPIASNRAKEIVLISSMSRSPRNWPQVPSIPWGAARLCVVKSILLWMSTRTMKNGSSAIWISLRTLPERVEQ